MKVNNFVLWVLLIASLLSNPVAAWGCACCVGSHRIVEYRNSLTPGIVRDLSRVTIEGRLDTADHDGASGGFPFSVKMAGRFEEKALKLKFSTSDGFESDAVFLLRDDWSHYKLRGTVAFPKEFPENEYESGLNDPPMYHELQFRGSLKLTPKFRRKLGVIAGDRMIDIDVADLVLFGNSNECFIAEYAHGWSFAVRLKNGKTIDTIYGRGTVKTTNTKK